MTSHASPRSRPLQWAGAFALLALGACATPNASDATATDLPWQAPEAATATAQPEQPEALGEPALAEAQAASNDATDDAPVEAPTPVDPLRPDVRLDFNDREAQTDLWARVRRGFALPDLEGALVRGHEQWYATRPDYVQRMTERGSRYLYHIVDEVERRGLPTELALLPFVESAFNPEAMSSAKASGMWQFMPATGRNFSLKQNVFRDDRRDVLASTRAALDYLTRLQRKFGNWQLALAAYNWGEGNVARAIEHNKRAGLPTGYTSLKMPDETRSYVPKLQAVKNIVTRPEAFGLALPALANHPYFLSVPIARDIDVDLAASLAGMGSEAFKTLNPQMNKPVILAAGTPQVLLPYDNANNFVRNLPLHRGRLASWTAWVAPKTLRPAEAAHLVGMSEERLREVNQIPPRMLVKAGSTLLVPRGEHRHADVSERVAENGSIELTPDGPKLRKMSLRAGRNDSVASVARRYGVSAAQVAQWNRVGPTAHFQPGQTIVVYVPEKKPAAKATRTVAAARNTRI